MRIIDDEAIKFLKTSLTPNFTLIGRQGKELK